MGKWTRRAVLSAGVLAGSGLIVGIALRPGNPTKTAGHLVTGENEHLLHIYLKIDAGNRVTTILPHSEMGQGALTALSQMLAEELDADWDLVGFEEAPAEPEYANYSLGRGYLFKGVEFPDLIAPTIDGLVLKIGQSIGMQITGGSMSIRVTGQFLVRAAGAAVREMLVASAAQAWGVPITEISTERSHLYHDGSRRSAPYSDFAATAASMTPSATPKLKKAADFTIMGQSKPRHDLPSKVDGSALFGIDVRRPGMVYAAIRRAPVFGGTLKGFDDSAARAMPGVIDIIKLDTTHSASMVGPYNASDAVAVVADSYWRAENALKALTFDWGQSDNATVDSESIYAQFDRDLSAAENRQVDRAFGNTQAVLDTASITLAAEYRVPYLAHACMEPMNATAEVSSNHAEVWLGCQNPLGFRQHVAEGLGMAMEQVTLHNHIMGGGFGRRATADYALQAALIARAVGLPVQLIWSREEDIRQDFYRPAAMSRFHAALNSDGHLIAWHNTYTDKHEPREAPLIPYSVPDQDIGYIASPTPIPFGAWRSVDHSQHGFFTESFVDEVAHAAGQDPFRYRAAMLAEHPRHLAVLERVAAEADWNTPLGPNRGRGIALQKSFGSIVGQVVEVTIEAGRLRVDRVVSVIDPGFAVSPDGLKAQIESGVIYGLTAALYGEITIEAGAVVQSNFHDYRAIRMDEAPRIQTFIINSGADLGGAGEPGVPAVAPALANAIFNATGRRIRTLPLMNTDFASLG